jgi:hypothetical protein
MAPFLQRGDVALRMLFLLEFGPARFLDTVIIKSNPFCP